MQNKTLKDMEGYFQNSEGYDLDTLIYSVDNIEPACSANEFSYGTTIIYPGNINGEYFMTKGHVHEKAETAEVYYCIEGKGGIIVGEEWNDMEPGVFCYIPPYKFHRAVNTGDIPFKFICVYRSDAGHNYNIQCDKRILINK